MACRLGVIESACEAILLFDQARSARCNSCSASVMRTRVSASASLADSNCASATSQAGLDVRIVQPRQDLAFLHLHPFLDEHLDDLAGDLGGNRRLPPRGDVARGVQHRALDAIAARLARQRRSAPRWPWAASATRPRPPPAPIRQHQWPRARSATMALALGLRSMRKSSSVGFGELIDMAGHSKPLFLPQGQLCSACPKRPLGQARPAQPGKKRAGTSVPAPALIRFRRPFAAGRYQPRCQPRRGAHPTVAIPAWPTPVIHWRRGHDDARRHTHCRRRRINLWRANRCWRIDHWRRHHDRRGLAGTPRLAGGSRFRCPIEHRPERPRRPRVTLPISIVFFSYNRSDGERRQPVQVDDRFLRDFL